ncbi:MAG TPA: biopolymer transporter ExbD [candidate division Zixibacteria bacterium]|nr:biopolymer transporter ExbD [candidate division Zixibacteria bacterium]
MKIKKKRRVNIVLDMTPMVDIAFLLLIFYMATTQFKPPEKKEVSLPSSGSQINLPERNVFMITVPPEDSVFIDYVSKRKVTLEDGTVTERTFRNITAIPFEEVTSTGKAVQNMRAIELRNVNDLYPGEANKEIRNSAKKDVLESLVVVKGDKEVEYGIMEQLMNSLRDEGINSFQVITELEQEE